MQDFQNKYFCYLFHDELLQTVFSRLKSHHNPTCSIDQTSSDVQVLCQHDLQKNNRTAHLQLHGAGCDGYWKCCIAHQGAVGVRITWAPTLSWISLLTGLWASIVLTRAGSLSRASNTRTDPMGERGVWLKQEITVICFINYIYRTRLNMKWLK